LVSIYFLDTELSDEFIGFKNDVFFLMSDVVFVGAVQMFQSSTLMVVSGSKSNLASRVHNFQMLYLKSNHIFSLTVHGKLVYQ